MNMKQKLLISDTLFILFVSAISLVWSVIGSAGALYLLGIASHHQSAPSAPTAPFYIAPGVRDRFTIRCPYCRGMSTVYLHVPDGVIGGHVSGEKIK
jgi:hypothetical protein